MVHASFIKFLIHGTKFKVHSESQDSWSVLLDHDQVFHVVLDVCFIGIFPPLRSDHFVQRLRRILLEIESTAPSCC